MFDLIERLRQKSDSAKKRIAFLTSFSLASIIFLVWLTVIYPDFSFREKQKQTASANKTGIFSSFMANITEGISGVKNQIKDIKSTVSSISTSTHYTVDNNSNIVPNDTDLSAQNSTTTQDIDPSLEVGI